LNGLPIQASTKDKLTDFVVQMALSGRSVATRVRNVRKAIRISRSMGSSALALSYVANGRFDAFVQQGGMSNWDVAAAGLIAERAGATVTDTNGGPWFDLDRKARGVSVVAAPPAHHQTILALIR
jgi:fructose-1,6-bisphosphatase/inositol monophosphatase family enzyme